MVEKTKKPKEAKKLKNAAHKRKKVEKQAEQPEEDRQSADAEEGEGKGKLSRDGSRITNRMEKTQSSEKANLSQNAESTIKTQPSKSLSKLKSTIESSKTHRGSLKNPTRLSIGIGDQQKSVLFMTPRTTIGSNMVPASSSYLISNKLLDDSASSSSSSSEDDEEEEEEEKQGKKDKKKKKKDKHVEEAILPKAVSSVQVKKIKSKAKKKEDSKTASIDTDAEMRNILIEKSKLKALPRFASTASVSIHSKEVESLEGHKKHKKGKSKAAHRKGGKVSKEMTQKLKAEQEQEAIRKAEEERIRLEQERLATIEKAKRELLEHQMRGEQLEKCFNYLKAMEENNLEVAKREREQEEWEFYLKCGRLPNVSDCGAMTTYLHLWRKVMQESTIKDVSERIKDVMELLANIEDVFNSPLKIDNTKWENLNWVHRLLREALEENLTVVTLQLISNIETNLNRVDPFTANFSFQDEFIKFNIWLRVKMPVCLPNPRKPMKPKIEIEFTNLNMFVQFPLCIPGENMAIRAMHLKYDHLSDRCETYYMPETSRQATKTLLDVVSKEWQIKQAYIAKNADQVSEQTSQLLATTKSTLSSEKSLTFLLHEVSSSTICLVEEFLQYEDDKKHLEVELQFDMVNMRKYRILGGIYYINLIRQPLQPQHLVTVNLTTANYFLPKSLDVVDYRETILITKRVSSVRASRSSVISETMMKKRDVEEEKRITIVLKKPSDVIFFEPPTVCYWDEDLVSWTDQAEDVENEGDTIIFRIQTYGAFGLLAYRYVNLPYQHWKMKPNAENSSIDIEVRTKMMSLLFRIKGDSISLMQATNSPNDKAFGFILDKPMKLYKLIKNLRNIGVDIFPEFDAILYVEPNYEKQWAMEEHLYLDMAKLSHTFKFARSRWNSQAGFRNIILQMKELNPTKVMQKCLLHVTPLKATILRSIENTEKMSLEEVDNIRFSADLYNLMKVTSGIAVRKMIEDACLETTMGVYKFLRATRFLSYS